MDDTDTDVSVAVLEWAVGAIARHVDAMWIHAPAADAIEEALRSGKKRCKPAELEALCITGVPPAGSCITTTRRCSSRCGRRGRLPSQLAVA